VLEKRVAALEGGIGGLALASGQAAITYSLLTIAEAGDNIMSSATLYGGTYNLFAHTLPQYGIEVRFADHRDPASFEQLIDARTKAIFCESVGNPLGNVTDFGAGGHRAPPWRAADRRQHRGDALPVPALRPRRRHRRSTR
jgi:O-acetylhomoserine (thiol)-lyase